FVLAGFDVGFDNALEIVNVVNEDVVQLVHGGLDVTGYRDIYHDNGFVFARSEHLGHDRLGQDVMRRAAGGEDDVDLRHERQKSRVIDDFGLEQLRHLDS